MNKIKTSEFKDILVRIRRNFHQYPELSGQEKRTSAVIVEFLQKLSIPYETYTSHYGVGAIITGDQPGPTIALRADMDALPVQEECDLPYQSKFSGCMHACGHDAHMAILLGVAKILMENRAQLHGTVKLIFQPAEEAAPVGGARSIIKEGFLEDVSMIFGLHVWPNMETGQIGIKSGAMMAASDRFNIKILGKGAHAAQPHRGIDSITIGAEVINSFSHIISRQINPVETATLSIGKIQGGERYNVIAKEVEMEGTIRSLSESVRSEIPRHMEDVLKGISKSYGANYEFNYQLGYPVLKNTTEQTKLVIKAAESILGKENVHTEVKPELASEDFAFYLQEIPGAFFWLGCKHGETGALHNSKFNLDENALPIGVEIMCKVVEQILGKTN